MHGVSTRAIGFWLEVALSVYLKFGGVDRLSGGMTYVKDDQLVVHDRVENQKGIPAKRNYSDGRARHDLSAAGWELGNELDYGVNAALDSDGARWTAFG